MPCYPKQPTLRERKSDSLHAWRPPIACSAGPALGAGTGLAERRAPAAAAAFVRDQPRRAGQARGATSTKQAGGYQVDRHCRGLAVLARQDGIPRGEAACCALSATQGTAGGAACPVASSTHLEAAAAAAHAHTTEGRQRHRRIAVRRAEAQQQHVAAEHMNVWLLLVCCRRPVSAADSEPRRLQFSIMPLYPLNEPLTSARRCQ